MKGARLIDTTMKTGLFILFLAILTSCGQEIPQLRVIRGNYNVSRGDYQMAIVDYLRARGESEYDPWIAYNLGNVYHFLGEAEAAVEQWNRAQNVDVRDLQFGAAFNRGVYLFEQGRYEDALAQFRFALTVNPSSMDAKRNFETTLERIESGAGLTRDGMSGSDDGSDQSQTPESTATRMLDYVRRKEEQRWRANAEQDGQWEARDW